MSPEGAAGMLWGFVSGISEELHFRLPVVMTAHSTNVGVVRFFRCAQFLANYILLHPLKLNSLANLPNSKAQPFLKLMQF